MVSVAGAGFDSYVGKRFSCRLMKRNDLDDYFWCLVNNLY